MAGKTSPNEIVQTIKDIIYFLELFRNGTQEDDPISFITDFLSDKKLKNVQIAHLILQSSLLNVIDDLIAKEEELHANDTDLQVMEFIDLFFDDTNYENNRREITQFQSRTVELIKEFLQIFPSSSEQYRNKIFFLLKDTHKDIIAEMSFNIYMKPLGEVIRRFGLWSHQYADDTQLYLSFTSNPGETVAVLNQCLAEHSFSISEASLSSNASDKPNSLEVAYLALAKAMHNEIEERSLMEIVKDFKQLVGLSNAFLHLIFLMTPLNLAVTNLFSEVSWKNTISENLDTQLTVAKRQDGIEKVLRIIMELLDLTSDLTRAHMGMLFFLENPVLQHAVERSVLDLLNETSSLTGLPHFNKKQRRIFIQGLFQTMLRAFLNESIIEENPDGIVNGILKFISDSDLPFKMLSSSERGTELLVILMEQWLDHQRICEKCQALYKHLNPEDALLLWKLQATASNILTTISDSLAFINNVRCAFKSCKHGLTRRPFFSILEEIHLVHGQYQHAVKVWPTATPGNCEGFVSLKRMLSTTSSEIQMCLHNITESNCECQPVSENIGKHMQMLTEILEIPLSGNPLAACLNNFSLPTDMKIKYCVQNTTKLTKELSSLTRISDEAITVVMEFSISQPKVLIQQGKRDFQSGALGCIVEELCSLPPHELYTLTVLLLKNLNLRNIIYKSSDGFMECPGAESIETNGSLKANGENSL
ncbi:ATP-binding cassette sub-family A member 13 [Varanus komodoensis]|nr:ATP-binding cassette sub-family A member 13 [Varanus komodoensis]